MNRVRMTIILVSVNCVFCIMRKWRLLSKAYRNNRSPFAAEFIVKQQVFLKTTVAHPIINNKKVYVI